MTAGVLGNSFVLQQNKTCFIMYSGLLFIHSWLRWLVLLTALGVLVISYINWFTRRPYRPIHQRLLMAFRLTFAAQFLLGIYLYFVESPIIRTVFYTGISKRVAQSGYLLVRFETSTGYDCEFSGAEHWYEAYEPT